MTPDSSDPPGIDQLALFECAPTALLYVDSTQRIGLINTAAQHLLDVRVQPGMPLRELWAQGLDASSLTAAAPVELDLQLRWDASGSVRVQSRPLPAGGWMVALHPVGDLLAIERALLATRSAGVGTWEVDLQTGHAFWDRQMWLLRGRIPQPEPIMKGWGLTIVHPDDQARLEQMMRDWGSVATPVDYEFRVLLPDGQVRWLASRSIERRDPVTGARSRLGVNWDVTDRRNAEEACRERELARAESQAKSRFLSRLSHELRTPLSAVLGFSQLLLDSQTAPESTTDIDRQRLEHIHRAGMHLLHLVNDVLEVSKAQGGEQLVESQPVPLRALLLDTLPLMGTMATEKTVSIRLGELDHSVVGDARRLRQVFLNLLTNAVKYNRAGGSVLVESTCDGNDVSIGVVDTGVGISEEQRQHLFEPFNRLGRDATVADGTGIGLVITKALVELMGGCIDVQSTPDVGSTFVVRLKRADSGVTAQTTHRPWGSRTFRADWCALL